MKKDITLPFKVHVFSGHVGIEDASGNSILSVSQLSRKPPGVSQINFARRVNAALNRGWIK